MLALFLAIGSSAFAEVVAEEPIDFLEATAETHSFVNPNETRPLEAVPIYELGTGGIYVAVGTERGFVGAALSGASRLVLIDRDPDVVRFNRINVALLRIAKDRQEYLALRKSFSTEQWQDRVAGLGPDDPTRRLLSDPNAWIWWEGKVRKSQSTFPIFVGDKAPGAGEFKGALYPLDEPLFQHLSSLAKEDKIESHQVNLENLGALSDFTDKLYTAAPKERLGVLDLANVWDHDYLGGIRSGKVIETFRKLSKPESVIMFTSGWLGENNTNRWHYFGARLSDLDRKKKATGFKFEEVVGMWELGVTSFGVVGRSIGKHDLDALEVLPPKQMAALLRPRNTEARETLVELSRRGQVDRTLLRGPLLEDSEGWANLPEGPAAVELLMSRPGNHDAVVNSLLSDPHWAACPRFEKWMDTLLLRPELYDDIVSALARHANLPNAARWIERIIDHPHLPDSVAETLSDTVFGVKGQSWGENPDGLRLLDRLTSRTDLPLPVREDLLRLRKMSHWKQGDPKCDYSGLTENNDKGGG